MDDSETLATTGATRPPGPAECSLCGCRPAAGMRFQSFRGFVLAYQVEPIEGVFCRYCGSHLYHNRQRRTLIWGWWSLVAFCVPFILLANRVRARSFTGLPEPVRTPGVAAPVAAPLPPGRRLLPLPVGIVLAVVTAAAIFIAPLLLLLSLD